MIRITVKESNGEFYQWWLNFYYYSKQHDNPQLNGMWDVNQALKEWGGSDIDKTTFIEFENEQDATLFMLRWS